VQIPVASQSYEFVAGVKMFFYDADSVRRQFGWYGLVEFSRIDEPGPDCGSLPFKKLDEILLKLSQARASGPSTLLPGAEFATDVTVCNQGTTSSAYAMLEVLLTADATLSSSDPFLGLAPVPDLNPGQCATASVPRAGSYPSGAYYFAATVDPSGTLPSSSKQTTPRSETSSSSAPERAYEQPSAPAGASSASSLDRWEPARTSSAASAAPNPSRAPRTEPAAR
jgi:hypothetical protein